MRDYAGEDMVIQPIEWERKGETHQQAHVNGYVLDVWRCDIDGWRWRVTKLIGIAAGRAKDIYQAKRKALGRAQEMTWRACNLFALWKRGTKHIPSRIETFDAQKSQIRVKASSATFLGFLV